MGGYIVDSIDIGFEAIRDIMVSGYKPSVIRLYDKPDMDHNFGSVKLKDEEAFMFFTAEGPAEISKGNGEGIDRIARKHGGRYIGTKAVEHWLEHRNDVCKTIGTEETARKQWDTNIFYATIEISASWTDIVTIYHNVMENVPRKVENLVMLGGHVSHSYVNGTNIYFVYQLKMSSPETSNEEQMVFIRALCDEVIKMPTGGVVHHHGMGKQRVCYARQEHGSSYSLMEDLKSKFDPNSIMNRGNLVQICD
jgi:FAD/FMN-containing dehydrogenase